MTVSRDRELQEWVDVWQAASARPLVGDEVGARARRRIRTLQMWAAIEAIVGVVALVVVGYRFVVEPALVERIAMALLGIIAVSGLALSWWQWRGIWQASADTTASFLKHSLERTRRLQRYLGAGWVILIAEIAVFVPWIRYRLYSRLNPVAPSVEWLAWGFLTMMVVLAVVCLLIAQRWVRREREALVATEREFIALDAEGSQAMHDTL